MGARFPLGVTASSHLVAEEAGLGGARADDRADPSVRRSSGSLSPRCRHCCCKCASSRGEGEAFAGADPAGSPLS